MLTVAQSEIIKSHNLYSREAVKHAAVSDRLTTSLSLNASDTVNPYKVIIASPFDRLNWPLPTSVNSCVSDKVSE